jgi:hypothetical protein
MREGGTLEADQSRFDSGSSTISINTLGRRIRVRITNSIFEHGGLGLDGNDEVSDSNEYFVSFSTFVLDRYQNCENPYSEPRIAVFENNIFYMPPDKGPSAIYAGSDCTLSGNITYPQQPDLGGTNINLDPKFVDLPGKNYRIQLGSPAVDAAVTSSAPSPDHDFAGRSRPQGARRDIGAFELQLQR